MAPKVSILEFQHVPTFHFNGNQRAGARIVIHTKINPVRRSRRELDRCTECREVSRILRLEKKVAYNLKLRASFDHTICRRRPGAKVDRRENRVPCVGGPAQSNSRSRYETNAGARWSERKCESGHVEVTGRCAGYADVRPDAGACDVEVKADVFLSDGLLSGSEALRCQRGHERIYVLARRTDDDGDAAPEVHKRIAVARNEGIGAPACECSDASRDSDLAMRSFPIRAVSRPV